MTRYEASEEERLPELVTAIDMFENLIGKELVEKNMTFSFSISKETASHKTARGKMANGQSANMGLTSMLYDPYMVDICIAVALDDRKMYDQIEMAHNMRQFMELFGKKSDWKDYVTDDNEVFSKRVHDALVEVGRYCEKNNISLVSFILMNRIHEGDDALIGTFGLSNDAPDHYKFAAFLYHKLSNNDKEGINDLLKDWHDDPEDWSYKNRDIIGPYLRKVLVEDIFSGNRGEIIDTNMPLPDQKHLENEGISQRFNTVVEPLENDFIENLLKYLRKDKHQ